MTRKKILHINDIVVYQNQNCIVIEVDNAKHMCSLKTLKGDLVIFDVPNYECMCL